MPVWSSARPGDAIGDEEAVGGVPYFKVVMLSVLLAAGLAVHLVYSRCAGAAGRGGKGGDGSDALEI